MSDDTLSKDGVALLEAARAAEPTLDPGARRRMREGVLGAIGVIGVGAATAAATSASAAPSAGVGAGAGAGAAAGTTSIAPGAVVAASLAKGVTVSMFVKVALLVGATAAAGGIGTAIVRSGSHAGAHDVGPPSGAATAVARAVAAPTNEPNSVAVVPEEQPAPVAVAPPSTPRASPSLARPAPPALAGPVPTAAPEGAAARDPRDPNAFTNEVASLDRARAALAGGDPSRALTVLEEPSQSAAFTEERQALRIVALCAAGRREEGRRELTRFRASFPRSLQTERARHACDGAAPPDPASGPPSP